MKYICNKCKRIVITKQHLSLNSIKNYKQSSKYIDKVASCFHCLAPRASDDMFDVDNIENLEKVSKIFTNTCKEGTEVLNIQGRHSKSCIMHYFPITPTCARPFLTNKDESFDNDLTCQLSEMIKANNLVKKFFSSGIKPNVKDLQHLVFRILITTMEKEEQAFCFGSCIWGDKQHTEEKRQTHQKTFMQKKCKSGGKNCVRRRCLFEDW